MEENFINNYTSIFIAEMAPAYYEKDERIRKRNHEQIKKDVVPFFLEKLDNIAKENDGYLALGRVWNELWISRFIRLSHNIFWLFQLTWADLNFVGMLDYFHFMMGFDLIENSPNLKRVVQNVSNVPAIKAWMDDRPVTRF